MYVITNVDAALDVSGGRVRVGAVVRNDRSVPIFAAGVCLIGGADVEIVEATAIYKGSMFRIVGINFTYYTLSRQKRTRRLRTHHETFIDGQLFELLSRCFSSIPPNFQLKKWPFEAGIREAILNSTYEIRRNTDSVLGLAEKLIIYGFSVLGRFSSFHCFLFRGVEEERREIEPSKNLN
ncbi:hypothetical protein EZV62_008978 [Acer yangbiense]|uniref:Uncharacterized protein n=1 Tax=Acer yangbiense TaxID=1000413 RepID=A0A5C7IEK4_9ROSI|nr:hypothetical protein EZV62_008978 [Acer yangbiense]